MRKKVSITLILIILLIAIIVIFPSLYLKNTEDIEEKIGVKTIYTITDLFKYSYLELIEPKIDFICDVEDNFSIGNDSCHIEVQSQEETEYTITCYLGENEIKTTSLVSKAEFDVKLNEGANLIKIEVKDGENIVKTWEKELAYITPYEKQFLDEYGNMGVALHLIRVDEDSPISNIELLKNLGVKYIRIEVRWEKVERNGVFNFSKYDDYMQKIEESGIEPVVILGAPGNLVGTDKVISSEEEFNDYLEYVDAVHNQYPFVQYYEIWNEPNFKYSGEDGIKWYSRMTNEVSNRLKSSNPNISVIAGSTVLTGSVNFITEITKNGTLLTSDSYSYHPYDISHTDKINSKFCEFLTQHYQLKNDIGGFQHFNITEFGLSSNTKDGVSDEEQAIREVQQSAIKNQYDIQKSIIYNFRNTGEEDSREQAFGIVKNNYVPKLAYYSLKNYNENTNGAEYIGTVSLADGLEAHVYDKDGKPKIIVWATNSNSTVTITYENFTAKDLYGNEIENTDGTLTISNSPVYLDNISTKYFYEAISNTATEKYNEFEEKFATEIAGINGMLGKIDELKSYMLSIANNETETQENAIKMMSEHFALGTTILNSFGNDKLDVEYVRISSMLDMLNDIGNSYEDLLTVSASSREAYHTATEELISKAETTINNNTDLDIVYPTKILDFAKELHEKSEYINGLEEENNIKTGLIVSNSLHAYYLADWANDFANIYVSKYTKANPITVNYSNTEEFTNQDVTATLNIGSDSKVTNNNGKNTYIFTKNGTFTFEYERRGQAYKEEATVKNIDKDAPKISGVINGKIYASRATPLIIDENLASIEVLLNGEKIQYTNGMSLTEEGIYNITAIDKAGNTTSAEIYIIEKGTDSYIIDDGYILNVKQNTTLEQFGKKLNLSASYNIKRNDNNLSKTDIVATGDILQLKNGTEYIIVVAGDINKDGKVTTYDLSVFRRYILNIRKFDEIEALAADINVDGQDLGVKDYTRMRIEILGEY